MMLSVTDCAVNCGSGISMFAIIMIVGSITIILATFVIICISLLHPEISEQNKGAKHD